MIDTIDPRLLVPWKANPRKIPASAIAAVARSIERFGFAAPIVVQEGSLRVIAGHTRLRAALKLKLHSVPVRFMSLSDADADALALADNRLAEGTDWDEKALAAVLASIGAELSSTAGFGDSTFDTPTPLAAPVRSPMEEWEGMPEHENEDALPIRQLVVQFYSAEDLAEFARVTGLKITDATRTTRYPVTPNMDFTTKVYVNGS
tara:strand:+ start:621 stop:1235 length:615 start_codon:yes stop_codon:yes gene_type:complete